MPRLHRRLRCLKIAITGKIPKDNLSLNRRFYLHAALLCWTIYSTDADKYGITHIMLFPGGKDDHSVEYYDKESKKLIIYRNKFIAIGRIGLA